MKLFYRLSGFVFFVFSGIVPALHAKPVAFGGVVSDTISPLIFCPPNDTVTLFSGDCFTEYYYVINVVDDQDDYNLIQASGIPSGDTFPIGTTVNAFVVVDSGGNTAACSFAVHIQPEATSLVCSDLIWVSLNENCTATIFPEQVYEPSAPAGCISSYIVRIDKTPPYANGPWLEPVLSKADLEKQYGVRLEDPYSGNFCWGNVRITDSIPPTMSCPDIAVPCVLGLQSLTPQFLRDSIGISHAFATVSDNCDPNPTLTFVDQVVDLPCDSSSDISGILIRTWNARDESNRSSTCVQTIERRRMVADVKMPGEITVFCDSANVAPQVTGFPFLEAGSRKYFIPFNVFCEIDVDFFDTVETRCGNAYDIRRSWHILDLCKPLSPTNPRIGVQLIHVADQKPPVIICPANITVVADPVNCTTPVILPEVYIADAGCSAITGITAFWGTADSLTGTLTDFPGNNPASTDTLGVLDTVANFPAGTTAVTYRTVDECGNIATCSFYVSVWDQEPPIAKCDSMAIVTLNFEGEGLLDVSTVDNGSMDSCAPLMFRGRRLLAGSCPFDSLFTDQVAFCCADRGDTISVLVRVYDIALPGASVAANFAPNQFDECLVKVAIADSIAGGCQAPADVLVFCDSLDLSFAPYGTVSGSNCFYDSLAVSVDYSQYDTVCRRGAITRNFTVFETTGLSASCSQTISIEHFSEYYVRFPDDKLITYCANPSDYGTPEIFGETCESIHISYSDTIFTIVPDACFRIERRWKIINECNYNPQGSLVFVPNPTQTTTVNHPTNLPGPIVSAPGVQGIWASSNTKINPTDQQLTDFSTFYSPDSNGYEYVQVLKFIDTEDPVVMNCPAAPVDYFNISNNNQQLWNELSFYDPQNKLRDLCEAPVDLSIKAIDLCTNKVTVNYLLFLDLDGDGSQETVVNSKNLQVPGEVKFGNGLTPNFSGGTPKAFDIRPLPIDQKYRFAVQTQMDSAGTTASVRWNTVGNSTAYVTPALPNGTHKIRWIVEDGCGNESTCEYQFMVKDTQKPTVVCINGLSANLGPTGFTLAINAKDLYLYTTDNCTPDSALVVGIRKKGTGTGFPTDLFGEPLTVLNFDCTEVGTQVVEIWSKDKANNTDYCETNVIVNDNLQVCNGATDSLFVCAETETGEAVAYVEWQLPGSNPALPPVIFNSGSASDCINIPQGVPYSSNSTLIPGLDKDHINGVTTFDLVLISRHIIALEVLQSPYKIIAADANKNGTVTSFDIVEFRRLILGIYDKLPANSSWRFVLKDHKFTNPLNPLATPFPEVYKFTNYPDDLPAYFIGIKIGDVNESAVPNDDFQGGGDDRTDEWVVVQALDRQVEVGEEIEIPFQVANGALGYQFTLDLKGLEALAVRPVQSFYEENYANFGNKLTFSWDGDQGESSRFNIVFRAKNQGVLSEMMNISSSITKAEAYTSLEKSPCPVVLKFADKTNLDTPVLLQNTPNPFNNSTNIAFYLPKEEMAAISIFDVTGRLVAQKNGSFGAGWNQVQFSAKEIGSSGIYAYRLDVGGRSLIKKMIVAE